MKAFSKLLFSILFLIPVLSFASVAQTNNSYPEIRRASTEKINNYLGNRDFTYERDYTPTTNLWNRIRRRIWEYLSESLSKNYPISLLDIILYLIVIVAIILIVYYFIKSDKVGMFSRQSKHNSLTITDAGEDIHQIDLDQIIASAIANGNYRIAIRYLYLKSLKDLSLKGLIIWKSDKTNHDYINELRIPAFQKLFREVTYLFDYAWYGNIEINEDSFQRIKIIFDNLNVQIHSGA